MSLIRNHTWATMPTLKRYGSNLGQARFTNNLADEETNFSFNPKMWDAIQKDLEGSNVAQKYRKWPFDHMLPPKDGEVAVVSQLAFAITEFFLGSLQVWNLKQVTYRCLRYIRE